MLDSERRNHLFQAEFIKMASSIGDFRVEAAVCLFRGQDHEFCIELQVNKIELLDLGAGVDLLYAAGYIILYYVPKTDVLYYL